jgi:hypothetical protein
MQYVKRAIDEFIFAVESDAWEGLELATILKAIYES